MEYTVTNQQRTFLKYLGENHTGEYAIGPWRRIHNILKNGIYYDDKNSFIQPPKIVTDKERADKFQLNLIADKYRNRFKLPNTKK